MQHFGIKCLTSYICFFIILVCAKDSFPQELRSSNKVFLTGKSPALQNVSLLALKKDSNSALPPPISASLSNDSISNLRLVAAIAGLAGAVTALHIYQYNSWWSNQRVAFHVIEDPSYQANFDKVGHLFGAYYSSHFFDEAFQWTGMGSAQSTTFGALCGAIWEYYVEIEDGFARDWGFSRGDAKSDLIGATFYLLRNRVPFLHDFNFKWFYE